MSYDRIVDVKVLGIRLGSRTLRAGPTRNVNFPYVLLGRALFHHALIIGRTHAERGDLALGRADASIGAKDLMTGHRRALDRCFARLRRGEDAQRTAGITEELAVLIDQILENGADDG